MLEMAVLLAKKESAIYLTVDNKIGTNGTNETAIALGYSLIFKEFAYHCTELVSSRPMMSLNETQM